MLQRDVAGGVREVEADSCTRRMRRSRNPRDVEILPGPVLHAGQHHQCDAMAFARQQRFEILVTHAILTGCGARLRSGPAAAE